MILEFVGLPGAGKSTHLRPLLKKLEERNIKGRDFTVHHKKIMSTLSGRLFFLFFLLFNIKRVIRLISLIKSGNTSKGTDDRIVPLLTMLFSMRRFLATHPTSVLIMDQGVVQMVCSIYFRLDTSSDDKKIKTTISQCKALLGRKMPSYHTVLFRLPISVAQDRIRKRGKKKCEFRDMNDSKLFKALSYYDAFFKNIPSSIIVNAEGEIDKNIAEINRKLIV